MTGNYGQLSLFVCMIFILDLKEGLKIYTSLFIGLISFEFDNTACSASRILTACVQN